MMLKLMLKQIVTLLLIIVLPCGAFAQKNRIKFDNISLEEGLSQSTVLSILQDSRGFMWFATLDGLNKYDGYTITAYRHKPADIHSIADNALNTIFEDSYHTLWIGTRSGGVSQYDRLKDKFINYQNDTRDSSTICDNNVISIFEDSENNLWFGTNSGLSVIFKADRARCKFTNLSYLPNFSETSLSEKINKITADKNGNLWLATNKGVVMYNHRTKEIKTFKNTIFNIPTVNANIINWLIIDNKNQLWTATNEGVFIRNIVTGEQIKHLYYIPGNVNSLTSNSITSILQDNEGIFWIGTEKGGLNMYNATNETFFSYKHDPSDNSSLSVDNIRFLYTDKANILWVGTSLGGVNKWNRAAEDLDLFRHNPYDDLSLSSSQVRTIYQDRGGIIWIGTVDGGLNMWDTATNHFIDYQNSESNNFSISSNHIRAIFEDSKGNFWVGTDGGGLNLMDRKTGKFYAFQNNPDKEGTISNNIIWDIFEDSKGNLWIATFGGGLNLYNYETKTFTAFKNDKRNIWSITDNQVTCIYEDNQKNLWIGTYGGGLCKWQEETQTFISYVYKENNETTIGNNRVYSIYQDTNNRLWIGTKGCLNLFDAENEAFIRFDESNGFPNDVFMGILEDEEGNLWVSTNQGLSRFNPETFSIRNYDVRDGLQSNEFLACSYCKADDGEMFFGGINGFNAFYPSHLKDNPHIPEIVITGFKIFNRSVELDTVISEKKYIELKHDQNFLSFDFVALDYIFPEKNQYAYMMVGVDKTWNEVQTRRFAIYNSLPPGSYTFMVKGSNNDEVWNEEGVKIHIVITPAFYQTVIFKVLLVLLGAMIIITIVWARIRSIKIQKERLEEEVKIRTAEVVRQKEDIEEKNIILEQQKEEIEAQRDEIEAKRDEVLKQRDQIAIQKEEIMDSIIYAKRIQTATLPPENFASTKLSEHFTLFRPKDIVSGDFYWTSDAHSDKLIVIAADCTGHGVPGAFMSMLGISFLNKIVNEKSITHPTEILNRLRENIVIALKQKGLMDDAKDGMDIALCSFDLVNNKLYFAGANNPLLFVRNGEMELYKGDKMPIAFFDKMDPFVTHEIDIQKGDCCYIFSDGYQDQFGGPDGKKFKTKKMKEIILANYDKPMDIQKQILEESLNKWMGPHEQVDDILVMGLKV